jgi:CRISPR-associated RAMP protein (TIGR02581 family)
MKFENRWKIEGTLTTETPLRIGDGDSLPANKRLATTYLKEDAQVNSVATDKDNKPYIPASAIKGNLRAWAKNVLTDDEIEIIFGSRDPQLETAKAGKVQFANAYIQPNSTDGFKSLPDWSSERLTAVSAAIAVNRKTRTASDKKLFHSEYVPAGITFNFELSGNDYQEELLKGDELFKKLLTLLKGFANGCRIGAETSGAEESWGKLEWNITAIKCSTADSINKWLADDSAELLELIPNLEALQKEAGEFALNLNTQPTKLSLVLECSDDFLVNDPSKTKKDKNDISDLPNHTPLRNKDGLPVLPKSSIKGAVRSQAERILRTMACSQEVTEFEKIACYPDDMKNACSPISDINDLGKLCLACQLFGASGWKSPVSFSDFTATKATARKREFVGIDRFTGGVSGSNKFNAEVAHQPTLTGEISVDFNRLGVDKDWAIGLLALTFRDLLEGDIRFGFGRAKGFGEVTAKIDGLETIKNLFGKEDEKLIEAVKALEIEIGGKK